MRKITIILMLTFSVGITAQCFRKVVAGEDHYIAISQDGTLWAWGENSLGQLGDGTIVDKTTPVQISTDNTWMFVSVSDRHSMAIKANRTLWAWGNDNYQALGNGTSNDSNVPVQIGTATNWKEVSAGERGTVAIKTDGTLWVWGTNVSGYLGNGAATSFVSNVPIQLGTATDWLTISGNGRHCLAVKTNGTLWVWGLNDYGQLGTGNTTNVMTPVQIGTATDWKFVDASSSVSFALKTNNTLHGWGYTSGMTFEYLTPQQVGIDTDWKTFSIKKRAQSQFILLTKTNGTLWGWGSDNSQQLGNGTSAGNYTSPTQISIETNWSDAVAGYFSGLAIKDNGTFWAWGDTQLVPNGGGFVSQPTQYSCTSLSISENFITDAKLYPNPVANKLFVDANSEILSMKVYDLNGRSINVSRIENSLDMSQLSRGIYILTVQTYAGAITRKIVKN
ncbi:T9SS type A sorting domain-containing protein [Flavobacterium sp. TBRC 19031]|uniref:T9SS type A sorting domain-containing protein n=1 Tax=Flavobacterium mekongense TaxID=3379707 RepID=UPI003999A1DB